MLRLLRVQVPYFKCGCAARMVIIEDFSYMHTIGQHKRLSLTREEGIQQNEVADRISEVLDPDLACSGTNLSPGPMYR